MLANVLSKHYMGGRVRQSDSSLKILHILDHSIPLHSGYTFRTKNIFHAQQQRGWSPIGLTTVKHEQAWSGEWVEQETVDGLCFYRSPLLQSTHGWLGTQSQLVKTLAQRLEEVIEQENPDLVHAHSPVLNVLPTLWVSRKRKLPVIYEVRAFWEDAAVDHGTYTEGSWKYRMVRSLETFACRQATHVAVLCEGIKHDLIGRGISEEKLTIIPNGINLEDFHDCQPDEELRQTWNISGKRVIGFIGSFYRYEGLGLLVRAFANLVNDHDDLVLLLVGGGEVKQELEAQIQTLGIQDKVVMPGRVPHHQIPGVYGLVDLFVYPRIAIRLTELVTPLKPLEAMVVGKPLVASDIGGHRELIQDGKTGVLFPPDDVDALSATLHRLLQEPQRMQAIARQGHVWAKQERSWEKTTSPYEAIYHEALNRS